MRLLITGATGYVGAWTARAAHHRGHEIRLLVRNADKAQRMGAALGFPTDDLVIGDLRDAAVVRQPLSGVDAVVHAAAAVVVGGDAKVIQENLATTRNVIGQAVELDVSRIVHVSSTSAIWTPGDAVMTPQRVAQVEVDTYAASKIACETYVRSLQDAGAPISITYPSAIIGPAAGHHLGESGDGLEAMIKFGSIPGSKSGLNVIDVRDLAEAHLLLLESQPGKRYVVSGHFAGAGELASLLNRFAGSRIIHLKVPGALVVGFGRLADRYRRWMPAFLDDMTEGHMMHLTMPSPADGSPIARELGLVYRPVEETMQSVAEELRLRRRT